MELVQKKIKYIKTPEEKTEILKEDLHTYVCLIENQNADEGV